MRLQWKKAAAFAQALLLTAGLASVGSLQAGASSAGTWVAGDFNTRTTLTTGTSTAAQVAAKAKQYGLNWIAAADLGGALAVDGKNVSRGISIIGQGQADIEANRAAGMMELAGFLWNVPGHDGAAVGMVGDDTAVKNTLASFEFNYDSKDDDTSLTLSDNTTLTYKVSKDANNKSAHAVALLAAKYLEDNSPLTSYILPVHPSRGSAYKAADLKELNDIAPTVFFGAELFPGSQKAATRGGYSGANETETTYGGADIMLAKVGGVWDTLLSEGRRFWAFGNSGYGDDTNDFAPGEYVKNYTKVASVTNQGILDGMRSGRSFLVSGDLINKLDYTITSNGATAEMGGTLGTVNGKKTVLTVTFASPAKNNNGDKPAVNHVDLIAGQVSGIPQKYNADTLDFVNNTKYLTAAYQNGDASATTKVVKTFTKSSSEWKTNTDGSVTITYTLPATDAGMYYRLRGTNLAPGTANETDASGNPLADSASNSASSAYKDLWFYSNPIFVTGAVDGAALQLSLTGSTGAALANTSVGLDDASPVTTDASGSIRFDSVSFGVHTLYVYDVNGNVTASLAFNLQSGGTTEIFGSDVTLKAGTTLASLGLQVSGSTLKLGTVAALAAKDEASSNPGTGDPFAMALPVLLLGAALGVSILSRRTGRH